ncbi:MAG: hypothetical protein AAGG06_05060 [Pseudomonadota bacterium]
MASAQSLATKADCTVKDADIHVATRAIVANEDLLSAADEIANGIGGLRGAIASANAVAVEIGRRVPSRRHWETVQQGAYAWRSRPGRAAYAVIDSPVTG